MKRRLMQYRVQFLDDANKLVLEVQVDAKSPANALFVAEINWPYSTTNARILDNRERILFQATRLAPPEL